MCIPVIRSKGTDGEITVKWRTIDKSAISGRDYRGGSGELNFKHAEVNYIYIVGKSVVVYFNRLCPTKRYALLIFY